MLMLMRANEMTGPARRLVSRLFPVWLSLRPRRFPKNFILLQHGLRLQTVAAFPSPPPPPRVARNLNIAIKKLVMETPKLRAHRYLWNMVCSSPPPHHPNTSLLFILLLLRNLARPSHHVFFSHRKDASPQTTTRSSDNATGWTSRGWAVLVPLLKPEHLNLFGNGCTHEESLTLCLVILILPARGTSSERSHTNKRTRTHARVRIERSASEIKPVNSSLADDGKLGLCVKH